MRRKTQVKTVKNHRFFPGRMAETAMGYPMVEVIKTMKLTQKESMLLQDLKTSEEICIEKYNESARKAEDQALADLFLTIKAKEEEHLNTINQLVSGKVPMMGNGQNGQGSGGQPGDGQATKQSKSKTDEYMLKDALDTEKHVSSVYDTCIFEFTDAGARSALNHIQKEEQEHGQMLYDYMAAHGMTA